MSRVPGHPSDAGSAPSSGLNTGLRRSAFQADMVTDRVADRLAALAAMYAAAAGLPDGEAQNRFLRPASQGAPASDRKGATRVVLPDPGGA